MPLSGMPIWFQGAEETLFNDLGRELIETLIVQNFILYRVNVEETESDFYGEAKQKIYKTPITVRARVQITDADIILEGGIRRASKGDMISYVYLQHMIEGDYEINVGDFIGYEGKYYEIYDAGYNKDSVDRKFGTDREYFREILAKVIKTEIFSGSTN
jgi:hypothetical protein